MIVSDRSGCDIDCGGRRDEERQTTLSQSKLYQAATQSFTTAFQPHEEEAKKHKK